MKRQMVFSFPFVLVLVVFSFSSMSAAEPLMVEKNLFSPDRKPPSDDPGPAASGGKPGLPAKSIQLDGVFIDGNVKKALVRVRRQLLGGDPKGQDPFPYITVQEKGAIGDYQVTKIDSRSITLAKDGQEYVVSLFAQGKVVSPPTPLPAGPTMPPAPAEGESPATPTAKTAMPPRPQPTTADFQTRTMGAAPGGRQSALGPGAPQPPPAGPPDNAGANQPGNPAVPEEENEE